jgi:hypothetical protein
MDQPNCNAHANLTRYYFDQLGPQCTTLHILRYPSKPRCSTHQTHARGSRDAVVVCMAGANILEQLKSG